MKKLVLLLLILICVGVAYAEKVELNYTIEIITKEDNGTGKVEFNLDNGLGTGSFYCDGSSKLQQTYKVIRNIDCGSEEDVQKANLENLSKYFLTYSQQFNKTWEELISRESENTSIDLADCMATNQVLRTVLSNNTAINASNLILTCQDKLQSCNTNECPAQKDCTEDIKEANNKNLIYLAIGIIVGAVIGFLYSKWDRSRKPTSGARTGQY